MRVVFHAKHDFSTSDSINVPGHCFRVWIYMYRNNIISLWEQVITLKIFKRRIAMQTIDQALEKLSRSEFRAKFHLDSRDRKYIEEKGMETVRKHAEDFIAKRLAPAVIPNDGRQTPMRGHPCFIAQHATGCCCRGCLQKWHHIAAGRPLTQDQINHIIFTLMSWIREHSAGAEHVPHTPDLF